jgi:DNA mismatch repair protein MutL
LSGRIVVLSEDIANKIAAGEVVERPASIVKELVENSIDAGADDILVELEKGGYQSIAVKDNGSGIGHEDVALVFERHATSKIHSFADIYNISSFGFRGEAMPSIASVAHVELLTRRKDDPAGTKASVAGGIIKEIVPTGCPVGTQIFITKIFENVPARRKFLKTEATEQSLCIDAVTRLALAHPEIRFKVMVNGRESFTAPVANNMSERIAMVMGADFSAHSIEINAENDNAALAGFVSRPEFTRSNSKNIFLFVNKRFVRDNSVTHAVMSAYRQIIEARRYPAAVLFLSLPPADVDVNVHPAKMEVRFKDSRSIHDLVSKTIVQSLAMVPQDKSNFAYRLTARERMPAPSFRNNQDKFLADASASFFRQNLPQQKSADLFSSLVPGEGKQIDVVQSLVNSDVSFSNARYLGQFANTYLVFAGLDGLLVIDQHAAHERIILERLKKSTAQKVISQPLLLPEVVSLPPGQVNLFAESVDFLQELGLEIEIFGRDAVVVKALPSILPNIEPREVIADIADQLSEQNQKPDLQERREKILAALACRAAIKANTVLSPAEVAALCRDLEETSYNLTCPHGRPVSVNFSLSEIERIFKRK